MAQARRRASGSLRRRLWWLLRRSLLALGALVLGYYTLCALALVALSFVDPPTTGVQVQRRVEAWLAGRAYVKRYDPVPLERISDHLEHAAVAAEDGRFYEHHGVDWQAIREAADDNRRRGRSWRGGSTITQQLVKNLFMTTHSSWLRKGCELPLAYLAELVLPKQRILELYLNVIEWGDGVYGAEAAARQHYAAGASALDRERAAALAACIPDPRRRNPERMERYRAAILERMRLTGW